MFDSLIRFIRDQYCTNGSIPLHAPLFRGNERKYVVEAIESTYVSSVGDFVGQFEEGVATYAGAQKAIAAVNGTAGLHAALLLAGVGPGDLVITQAMTFVATCNAIRYCNADPVFIDVDKQTLSLSPVAMVEWLIGNAYLDSDGRCRVKDGDGLIKACVPMHTFGHPALLGDLVDVCKKWGIALIEDAAESLGSLYRGRHTGTFGLLGVLSFNGNKIITTGGGGMILTDTSLGRKAKHLTTTAKLPHPYEFIHDEVGYNYRMPNINAALGCAQLEQLEEFVESKRKLAGRYQAFFSSSSLQFVVEPPDCRSNYWLNAVVCENQTQRDELLMATNAEGVMTRPIWALMNHLPMYKHCRGGRLDNAEWLAARVVNIPSSVLPEDCHET